MNTTVDLREHRIAVVAYDESRYRQGERQLTHTVIGTPEQIGERVKETVIHALSYGSHVTALHITPIAPHTISRLDD
jgi:hypothetical protein